MAATHRRTLHFRALRPAIVLFFFFFVLKLKLYNFFDSEYNFIMLIMNKVLTVEGKTGT